MKAVVLRGSGSLRLEERTDPKAGAGELVLRTSAAAICGSDLRMLKNGYHGVNSMEGCVMGHEISGTICGIGEGVEGFRIGERVTVAPNMGCGECEDCRAGNYHLCRNYRALGIHMDGGFAEYVRIPAAAVAQGNVMRIPEHLSDEKAALCEPLSCVYNGLEKCSLRPGETVLVFGAGAIGAMHAMLALAWGASKVFVYDPSQQRAALCAQLSPKIVPFFGEMDALEEWIMQQTQGAGVDVCVTACPAPAAQQLSLHLLSHFGRVCFFGGLPKTAEQVELNTNLIHYKELCVVGSTRASTAQFAKTLEMISDGTICVDGLISQTYPIDAFEQAFEDARMSVGFKTLICF